MRSRRMRWLMSITVVGLLVGSSRMAAGERTLNGRPVDSVFFIEKSENRNQVHYGVRVDEQCRPAGEKPVYGYWRNLERGPNVRSKLLWIEQPAYGVAFVRELRKKDRGGSLQFALRALPDRLIAIELFTTPEGCRALAATRVQGGVAQLMSIYVKVRPPFGVDHVVLRAERFADGVQVSERIRR